MGLLLDDARQFSESSIDAGPSHQESFSSAGLKSFMGLTQQMTAAARDGREGFEVAHKSG